VEIFGRSNNYQPPGSPNLNAVLPSQGSSPSSSPSGLSDSLPPSPSSTDPSSLYSSSGYSSGSSSEHSVVVGSERLSPTASLASSTSSQITVGSMVLSSIHVPEQSSTTSSPTLGRNHLQQIDSNDNTGAGVVPLIHPTRQGSSSSPIIRTRMVNNQHTRRQGSPVIHAQVVNNQDIGRPRSPSRSPPPNQGGR
jgi:hypothetical protein